MLVTSFYDRPELSLRDALRLALNGDPQSRLAVFVTDETGKEHQLVGRTILGRDFVQYEPGHKSQPGRFRILPLSRIVSIAIRPVGKAPPSEEATERGIR